MILFGGETDQNGQGKWQGWAACFAVISSGSVVLHWHRRGFGQATWKSCGTASV
jgi:hypothetical protein